MEWETLVSVVALGLQVAGWASLALSKLSPTAQATAIGEKLLIGCLVGLGCVTLVGAWLYLSSALTSGFTTGILLLVGIFEPIREIGVDPYATIYSSTAGA